MDAFDTEQRIRARAPAAIRTRHRVIHVRVSFGIGLLGRYQFKEALTSFPLHHAAPKLPHHAAPVSDRPNHAHLRRAPLPEIPYEDHFCCKAPAGLRWLVRQTLFRACRESWVAPHRSQLSDSWPDGSRALVRDAAVSA